MGGLLEAEFSSSLLAQDADDRIIYDQSSGNIFYDEDGTGSSDQVLIARVEAGTQLDASDFQKAESALIHLDLDIGLFAETPKDLALAPPAEMIIA